MSIFRDILKVLQTGVGIKDSLFVSDRVQVPGIGTGAAYAAADAFGVKFSFTVPVKGTIINVIFQDLDDEGLDKELNIFNRDFTETADNAAFAPSDDDLLNCIGVANIDTWYNFANNQIGMAYPALGYVAPTGLLYAQLLTRGADNIASGAIPKIFLVIV